MEKARLLYQQLYPDKSEDEFNASNGWLHRFNRRHDTRKLTMKGESLSANSEAAEEFKVLIQRYVEENMLSLH